MLSIQHGDTVWKLKGAPDKGNRNEQTLGGVFQSGQPQLPITESPSAANHTDTTLWESIGCVNANG